MIDRLINALVRSKNEAADVVLLEALRLGTETEQRPVLSALLRRKTVRGLAGVVGLYADLPESLQLCVLDNIQTFYGALRESGRSQDPSRRLAAMKLIALGRQGKLCYVLSENLHSGDGALSTAAAEAIVALARWVAVETRRLQGSGFGAQGSRGEEDGAPSSSSSLNPEPRTLNPPANPAYTLLLEQRPEIEAAVARTLDVHRGRHGQDLMRAALLLCDWPGSKTLAILKAAKHAGQSPMARRLQQPPASEHIEAFLLGASHAQLRSHFPSVFAQIDEAPVLDALLRRTHWLKDQQLRVCVGQITRGVWWDPEHLARDLERRGPDAAARVGEWLAASGAHDVLQDERMRQLASHAADSFPARLRLLRAAAKRPRGSSVQLLASFLNDPDERLVRLAARELIRRRPPEHEGLLLQRMTDAPPSVRKLISRGIGKSGFENFWQRFDRLNKPTRRRAGQAMLKILPDAVQRIRRRLAAGPVGERLKAMQVAHELDLAGQLHEPIVQLCTDPDPKLRSKAVTLVGELPNVESGLLVDRLMNDSDARVRANAVEVLEAKGDPQFLPVLAQRARAAAAGNRERANAIKALARLRVGTAGTQLLTMLRDGRPDHRISAMWTLKQIGWWQMLGEVGRLAKSDPHLRVRRYALGVIRGVAELAQQSRKAGATAQTGA